MTDVWEMFRRVLEERRKRELEPTIQVVRDCLREAERTKDDPLTVQRLNNMLEFFETCDNWYHQVRRLPTSGFVRLFKIGSKLHKLLA